jgi:predicted phage terminase large subunit-like protein
VASNTWWSDDDLAGRLQQQMALIGKEDSPEGIDDFEIIKYPALSEQFEYRDNETLEITRFAEEQPPDEGKQLLRVKDFCLHEERYPTQALKRIRANLQPRIWSALYQQNPVPDEGMYFKKDYFRYVHTLPSTHGQRVYTAWDFAIGEKQQNDWTVGATVLQDETDTLYVLEIHRMKGDSFQIVEAMLDVAERWGTGAHSGYLIGAEDGQIWRAIEPMLKKRMSERRMFPPYEVLRPLTDKLARARPLQGRMQQNRVIFPEGAHWRGQAEQELLRFPAGAHDDVVDALAWVVQLCIGKEPPRVEPPPRIPSWRDRLNLEGSGGSHMTA